MMYKVIFALDRKGCQQFPFFLKNFFLLVKVFKVMDKLIFHVCFLLINNNLVSKLIKLLYRNSIVNKWVNLLLS